MTSHFTVRERKICLGFLHNRYEDMIPRYFAHRRISFCNKLFTSTFPPLAFIIDAIPENAIMWGCEVGCHIDHNLIIVLISANIICIILFLFPQVNLCTCKQWYSIREYKSEGWWYSEWCLPTDRRYWHTRNSFWKTE